MTDRPSGSAPDVEEIAARNYYNDPDFTADKFGVTATTTDAELAEAVAAEEADNAKYADADIVVTGVAEYLAELREGCRDAVRAELDRVTDQRALLALRRNELIRQLASWGDSDRSIAARTDLSDVAVREVRTSSDYVV